MHAMECIIGKDFGMNGVSVRFSSAFHGDYFHFMCYDKFEDANPFPGAGFDKEQVEGLRDWLNGILQNYDKTSNLCQNCFKALPKTAELDDRGYWIVTCQHCSHQHEIGKNE
jgi:hypothetical protein